MTDKMWMQCLMARLENGEISEKELAKELDSQSDPGCPELVTASPRFQDDVNALGQMLQWEQPPIVNLRSKNIVIVVYGFGDASGTGLGATFTCGSGFTFRIGIWGSDESGESSNWREFTNVVESLEDEANLGNLTASEVFMFTDNSTVESCSVKGSSSSPKLLDLIIRLRSLTTRHGVKVHIFHVAGTRMIAQGTDGVSRGALGEGIMSGESMTSFIPIHLSALDRHPELIGWIKEWSGSDAILLDTIDCFDVGHDTQGWTVGWDNFK